jgi:hypothetical protein
MTLYEKDTSFSVGWMIGAAVLMTIASVFAGLALGVLGVPAMAHGDLIIIGVSCACYLGVGFFVGLKSEGRTIIEAGLGAAIATGAFIAIQVARNRLQLLPLAMAIACTPPFVCGIIGAFIGEKVQGDTVEVQD